MVPGILLNGLDLFHCRVERGGHRLMHQLGLISLDEQRCPAVAAEQLLQLLVGDARQDGRVGDLVSVEMQDRQHRTVGGRVEKLVGVPRRGQRPGFGLAIANDTGDDEVGIVEHGPERMAERIPQLPTFVNGPGALRRGVTWNPTWKRKLPKELLQPGLILA